MRWATALALLCLGFGPARAEPPGLRLLATGPPVPAVAEARPGCGTVDIPDAPAHAFRRADGTVQLHAADLRNRVNAGPDLLHVRHGCASVLAGGNNDDPAAFDDRAWLAAFWTEDGRTVWAVVHNEFQGHRRPVLCSTGRYMDCWYNALTAAVSHDGGRSFQRMPGRALVAAPPYRYDQVGRGHHGYFNPSGIVSLDGALYMFAFATRTGAQRPGNCLLRTTDIAAPDRWRAWDGRGFGIAFADPYAAADAPERHVCTPVGPDGLRWPVTGLVRHRGSGLFVAVMQDGARGGGVFYATSRNLLHWSDPAMLLPAIGPGAWTCGDPPPLAFPSLLDPASPDRSFATVGDTAVLLATRFDVSGCATGMDRTLVRWQITAEPS